MKAPVISVVLPVYNAQLTVSEAISSLLVQTFSDFELIIINDGSSDSSEDIILSYADARIRYYSNKVNCGLIYTLNLGIELARGKYIARMDADDISFPKRFEKQLSILENNENIIVCGTKIEYFGIKKWKSPFVVFEQSTDLKEWLLRESCFAHPTVMIRKDVLINNNIRYNQSYFHAEDYKLWIDLSNYGDFYNIPEVLLKYRLSSTQVTQSGNSIQQNNARKCRREYLSQLFPDLEIGYVNINLILLVEKKKYDKKYLKELLYLSCEKYNFRLFFHYITSFDWMQISALTNMAILKRFCGRLNPLL